MLLTSQCPHCKQVLDNLVTLVKDGTISQLEIINIEQQPDLATDLNVRSVPWLRLGRIELSGARTLSELREWAAKANSTEGMVLHLNELLTTGQMALAVEWVKKEPDYMDAIMIILAEPEAKINVRVGIGVIMEALQGSEVINDYVVQLGELTLHKAAPVRADAAYYLALTQNTDALPYLKALLSDESAEVKEIAEDGLNELQ